MARMNTEFDGARTAFRRGGVEEVTVDLVGDGVPAEDSWIKRNAYKARPKAPRLRSVLVDRYSN